jgi:hypothetical protein
LASAPVGDQLHLHRLSAPQTTSKIISNSQWIQM